VQSKGTGTHLVPTLHTGVQGKPWPFTMLSERDVHSSFHCSQPLCSPFRCSWWWFGRTSEQGYNSAIGHFLWLVRSPGTGYHWTFVRHRHYQRSKDISFLTFLLHWL